MTLLPPIPPERERRANLHAVQSPAELKNRLLEVFPEAEPFFSFVEKHGGLADARIHNEPWPALEQHGDQTRSDGPFWTLVRPDSGRNYFHVISFGLNPKARSICTRRRTISEGAGGTHRQESDIRRYFLNDNFKVLKELYYHYFLEHQLDAEQKKEIEKEFKK